MTQLIPESYQHDAEHDEAYWISKAIKKVDAIYDPTVANPSPEDISDAILFLQYAHTANLAGPIETPQYEFEFSPFDHPYRS